MGSSFGEDRCALGDQNWCKKLKSSALQKMLTFTRYVTLLLLNDHINTTFGAHFCVFILLPGALPVFLFFFQTHITFDFVG